ncbi:MAG TPA: hypothetical protein VGL62_05010 [Vicinamibacterales bacterium]|jgi:aminodeoxyfutalosine synthase
MIAEEILQSRDLIAVGARGDEERRRRHGARTTFVRVLEVHADAIPPALASHEAAGELRLVGAPTSVEAAVSAVATARAIAGSIPVTAFSLSDLAAMADSPGRLRDVLAALAAVGLETIAEAPIDLLRDPVAAVRAARDAGLRVPRLTVHRLAESARASTVALASAIQAAAGGVRAFAPLPRIMSIAQPSTGYDDVKQIALARLMAVNIESIQVDWSLYGPKLAQVALTMGADDVDGVSALPGTLGRRRSPIEEIRGNIVAAGLEPQERDARFEPLA